MTAAGWLEILAFCAVVVALTRPLGSHLLRVFQRDSPLPRILTAVERGVLRLCGTRGEPQTWWPYARDLLAFNAVGICVLFALQLAQGALPLNPQHFGAPSWDLALNTAVSFASNTDWQAYAGETTLGNLVQMAGLTWQNFVSAATGIAVALALVRGITGRGGEKALGNFTVDLVRATLWVLLPIALLGALFFASQGVVQSFAARVHATTLDGGTQLVPLGTVASQEAIKLLGTNGGGFFAANSAHPFENPTPLTNFVQVVLVFAIPAALTWTYGRMAGDARQGWAIFAAMAALFLAGVCATYAAESAPNAALDLPGVAQAGNLEGKETRFGIASTALFATVTTAASCGAVNGMLDSFTPLGGLVPLVNLQLGEVIFGGVGAGLYGMLVFAVLTVFVAGLMVGRTPEFLGKKVEAAEMTLVTIFLLVSPVIVLVLTGWSAVVPYGASARENAGPHGLTEMLYAYSSAAANNGSAFAGLGADTRWWNLSTVFAMLAGRYAPIVLALALAGRFAGKKVVAPGPGTFPTTGPLFSGLLAAIVVIFGALTFFPALALGPVVEQFLVAAGRTF